jgi:Uma2 family endonuclease
MTVIQPEPAASHIPDWVRDLASFRRWAKSEDFPSRGWYAHLNGRLWVDPSMETAAHNNLKSKFVIVLKPLVEDARSGDYYGDRMLLTNLDAGLSTEPDGMFVSFAALKEERAQLKHGDNSLEVLGSPEMVLEVVSSTSVQKDTRVLRDLYWQAGVQEYWLADPRGDDLAFDILKRVPKGYAAARKQAGWLKSPVFGKSFRLTRRINDVGMSIFDLAVK